MSQPYTDEQFREWVHYGWLTFANWPRRKPATMDDLRLMLAKSLEVAASSVAARAWDEGHRHSQRRGPDDCQCFAHSWGECACGEYGNGPLDSLEDNPYRGGAK